MDSDSPGHIQNNPNLRHVLELIQGLGEAEKNAALQALQSPGITPKRTEDSDYKNVNKEPEEKLGLSQQPTRSEMATSATSSSSNLPENSFATFKKRSGCISQGDDFEILMCGLYALKLSMNDEVVDFNMTSNEDDCGAFDDIKLDVTFKNGARRLFLLQLKHKTDKKKCIRNQQLFSNNDGDFSLPKYFKSQAEINKNEAVCIIYTNCLVSIQGDRPSNKFTVEKCNDIKYIDIILNSQESDLDAIFKCKCSKTDQIIYLLGRQKNVNMIQNDIKETLQKCLQCDIYHSFFHFMKEWWSGRFVLNKHDFIMKLTEMALSPFIKTVSGSKHNKKTIPLKQAIMEFQMTIVKSDEDNIVENIWPDDKLVENDDYSKTAHKFQLDLNISPELTRSKILWHMSKVPLIIKVNESNKETVKSVLKIFQKNPKDKKVVLIGNIGTNELSNWDTFGTVRDLIRNKNNEDINQYIAQRFYVSLQGRDPVPVEKLLDIDEKFAEILEVEHLLKMSQRDLVIGERHKELSDEYISRDVTMPCIHTKKVIAYSEENINDTLIIINCDRTFQDQWKQFSKLRILEMSDYLNDENVKENEKFILLSTNKKCTIKDFEHIYQKSKKSNVYLFQANVDDSGDCVLLMSRGRPLQFKEEKKCINEKYIHRYFNNSFNVFCAPPGMGKTTLMEVLNYNTPSENWAIYVNLIKHNAFLSKQPDNETILNHFLQLKENNQDSLMSKFKECLKVKNKMYIYLDGLDEVDSKNVNIVMNFIKYVSSQGINIWVSSRENLREKLSRDLSAVPVEIRELNEEQQKEYINKRLENKFDGEKIENIMNAIFKSSDINNSRDLLGIPLQLHIITEMFLTNDDAFKNLEKQNLFVLTQMYSLYFEGKKKSELNKLGLDEQIEYQLGINYDNILEQYEIPALRTCLDEEDYKILEADETKQQNFLLRIKEKGDKYGIIKTVDDNCETVFIHQTYAEYFACSWLKKNLEKARLLRDRIFAERYENLRLMFDVMLAENNPLHLAIIYKNMEQFENNIQRCEKKDFGGRTALCLACMYGAKYTKEPKHYESWRRYRTTYYSELKRESNFYTPILKSLLQQNINIKDRDLLFDLDYIQYSLRSKCLFPIEMMLETKKLNFDEYKEIIFKFYEREVLAGYAAQFGYSNLFVQLSKNMSYITESKARELLEFAILGTKDDVHTISRPGNNSVVNILIQNHHPNLNGSNKYYSEWGSDLDLSNDDIGILDFACKYGCYDVFETLIQNGAKCSDGNTILHSTAKYGTFKEIVIEIYQTLNRNQNSKDTHLETAMQSAPQNVKKHLERVLIKDDKNIVNDTLHKITEKNYMNKKAKNVFKGVRVDINVCNDNGQTALHLACEKGKNKIAKKLIENGADVNSLDNDNNNVLHYALIAYEPNQKLLMMLIDAGLHVNARNKRGQTALHLACENGKNKIAKKLIENGADINILDNDNNNALHYAWRAYKPKQKLFMMLIDAGLDVNFRNKIGQTALHLACGKGYDEIAEKLIENGADVNILNKDNNNALHYASTAYRLNQKLLIMLTDAGLDVNARNKSGQTALHLACGMRYDKIAKTLIENGADVNILDNDINNAFYYAWRDYKPNQKLLMILTDAGLDVNARNKSGQTALHLACQEGFDAIAKKLIENSSDINTLDTHNNSMLHYASKCNRENTIILQNLICFGLEVNVKNIRNETPLHLTCKSGVIENFTELISRKAKPSMTSSQRNLLHYAAASNNTDLLLEVLNLGFEINARDIYGASALHIACKYGNINSIEKLIQHGADIHAANNKNMTALHYATLATKYQVQVIEYLLELGIDSQAKDANGRNAMDYALEKERYLATQIFIENKIFWETFNTGNVMFLYCSVYSGSNNGVKLFLNAYENVDDVDIYNEKYPLYFASRNGQLDAKKVQNMTTFVQKLIIHFKFNNIKYTRQGFIDYLKLQEQKYGDIDFIIREAQFPDWDDYKIVRWLQRCTEIEPFVEDYCEKHINTNTPFDSDDDF